MRRLKALIRLPLQILWWAATFQLGRRLRFRRDYRLLAQSGLFDAAFCSQQSGAKAGTDPLREYLARGGFEGRDPHPLFDSDWYLRQDPAASAAGINPLLHYVRQGWKEGRNPHPFFDSAFYLERNPDVKQARIDPLRHYLMRGASEGRDPHPLFNDEWYVRNYHDAIASGETPLTHYVLRGAAELRDPHPLFDAQFYVTRHPDAAATGMDPLRHYLTTGASQHYSPHPLFDANFYVRQNPDLESKGSDLLQHYILEGAKNGLDPCDLFDSSFYFEEYPEVAQARLNPLAHYWTDGVTQGCNPNPLFQTEFYLKQYPGIAAAGVNPLLDFIEYGAVEGRFPNPFFDPLFYLEKNPDVKRAGANPLAHYLKRGAAEGRDPGPFFSTKRYISEHPELEKTEINPLAHFLGYRNQPRTVLPPSTSIAMFNEALRNASDANHHLLVSLGPVSPDKEATGKLLAAFEMDPHFGIAAPRQSNASSGEILKLSNNLGDPELAVFSRAVLESAPAYYILPEMVSSCFLLRDSVVSNFGQLDESYETLAGALQDYLCRARRCGFRCVVVNNAIAPSGSDNGSWLVDVEGNDLLRIHTKYPDVGRAKVDFIDDALHRHESLLGRALSRDRSARKTLLLDLRGLPSHMDGTAEASLGLCDGLRQLDSDWTVSLWAAPDAAKFHALADRYPYWELIDGKRERYFTAALRPSQPWNFDSMVELHRMALFNFYTMLDTIAWDILFVAPRGLDATWEFLSEYADGVLYISQYTRDRFATRFPSSTTTPGYVSRLSLDPADYRVKAKHDAGSGEQFVFVVGNAYDHKDVGPTVDALASAFPSLSIKALGPRNHSDSHVECLESGRVQQADMDRLFAQAAAIVFPSFYEGFGFPVIKGLSNGRTVIARHSELLLEVASHYRGPGRLISFRNPRELIEAVTGVLHGSAVIQLSLGDALSGADQPRDWTEVARGVLGFIEGQVQDLANYRWPAREKAIEQMDAYSGQR